MHHEQNPVHYAGFADRLVASLVDSIVQLPIVVPLLWILLKTDIEIAAGDPFLLAERLQESLSTPLARFVVYGLPLLYCLVFWKFRSATPGKLLMDMKIVDATTGEKPTTGKLLLRCVGYAVNMLTLFAGFLWIAFDKRRQGLHDKMANTVVIMMPKRKPQAQD